MTLLVWFVIICIIWHFWHKWTYSIRVGTLNAFVGTNGSGKTFWAVKMSVKIFRRRWFRTLFSNALRMIGNIFRPKKLKKPMQEMPVLVTNIPVFVLFFGLSYRLKSEHLLLQERLPYGSVILLDECGQWCSQFDFNNKNAVANGAFDEFCRLCRHYGDFVLFATDQCSENIILSLRRRLQTLHNMMDISFWPLIHVNTARVRTISVNESIKTVEEGMDGESSRLLVGFTPFIRQYDSRTFSKRYDTVPQFRGIRYARRDMKANTVITIPKYEVPAKTDNSPLPQETRAKRRSVRDTRVRHRSV